MKRIILILLLGWNVAYGQCPDEDTVRVNAVTLITATTARVNGSTTHYSSPGSVTTTSLRYVRVGLTDTATASGAGATPLRNLSGLQSATQYYYYYATTCGITSKRQVGAYYFTTISSTISYTPMAATGYSFKYLRADSGFAAPFRDTSVGRGTTRPGSIVCNTLDSNLYRWNGLKWLPIAIDSAGLQAQINLKVDSVTVASDTLFYWINGTAYGTVLVVGWGTLGNTGTNPATNFIGTSDTADLAIRAGGTNRIFLQNNSHGSGAVLNGSDCGTQGGTAIGGISIATGFVATAIANSTASGSYSISAGYENISSSTYGVSIGAGLKSKSYGGMVAGIYNDSSNATSATSSNPLNRIFQIGNGTSDVTRSNAMTVLGNGKVGIGVLVPDSTLHIVGGLKYANGSQGAGKVLGSDANGGATWVAASTGGVTNIATGLGLSGGPITTTGTIILDTASVSVISRQRAAATYLPLAGGTLTGALINSTNGATSAPANRLTGTWFTGGTATTTKPQLLIEPAGTTSTAWSTSGTGVGINAASGFTGNSIDVQLAGVSKFSVSSSGQLFASNYISTASYYRNSSNNFHLFGSSTGSGALTLYNGAESDAPLLQFGGTSASFPALKRSTTSLQVRLADDSGFASEQSLYLRFGTGTPEGVVTAPIGAFYSRTDGGAGTSLYVKESGVGNTGWIAK